MLERLRIINVERKPSEYPVCGKRVPDIIYGTGDITEVEFMLDYRKDGIMGADNILYRRPIWTCACGCKRFRKVNPDGTDALVKVKLLKIVGNGYILIPTFSLGALLTIPSNTLSTLASSSLDNAYMQSITSRLAAIFLCARMVSSPPMEGRFAPHDSR